MEERIPGPTAREARVNGACCHHWDIEGSVGPVSKGVCHLCHEVREFRNYIEESSWFDHDITAQSAGRETRMPE